MHYLVTSPEMSEIIPILDDGSGPIEYFSCAVFVEARNKNEAKKFAIKTDEFKPWVDERRCDNLSPFTGLVVEETLCPHGACWCEGCADKDGLPKCDPCFAQFEKEVAAQTERERLAA